MSRYGSRCEDCVRCTECPEVADCLSEPGTRPCAHDKTLCENCRLTECAACRVDAGLAAAWEGGDPFDHGGHDPDPWGPLAAESRAVTDRFWSAVGPRIRTKKDAS